MYARDMNFCRILSILIANFSLSASAKILIIEN